MIIQVSLVRLFTISNKNYRGGNIKIKNSIFLLLLISVLLISISTTFALDNENTLNETDNENCLTISDNDIINKDNKDLNDVVKAKNNVVNNTTFHNYFDTNGNILNNVTVNELIFDGDFTGIDVKNITINKTIKFIGNKAIFNNVTFIIKADNVTIDGFNITQSNNPAIQIGEYKNTIFSNNNINFTASKDQDSFAILTNYTNNLKLINNTIMYVGNTNGTVRNYAIYIKAENITFNGNIIKISTPSTSESKGIVFYSSDNVEFLHNIIDLKYNGTCYGSFDAINVVEVDSSCDMVVIRGNNITALGGTYVYGVNVKGSNFVVEGNRLNIASAVNYACGVNPDASAFGVVRNNDIIVSAPIVGYGVYSGMWSSYFPLIVNYTDNNISVSAFFACGVEIGGAVERVVGNNISLEGNFTAGVIVYKYAQDSINSVISNNVIIACGSNVGNASSVYDMAGVDTVGIKITAGNIVVNNNYINTTGNYSVWVNNTNATVSNNYLLAKYLFGDDSVFTTNKSKLYKNLPSITYLNGSDVTKVYGDSGQYVVRLLDGDGDPISNKTIRILINGSSFNVTTTDGGVASFDVVYLAKGIYNVSVSFDGDDDYFSTNTSNIIVVNSKPTVFTIEDVDIYLTNVKSGYDYSIVLKDSSGNPLAGKQVSVTFNGASSSVTTGKDGKASYKLSASKCGSYKISVSFSGDGNYSLSSAHADITLNKQKPSLSVSKTSFKVKTKTKKVKVVLRDAYKKGIGKVSVSIKVNKKLYRAKTNSKGVALVKVKLTNKGTYKAIVKFAGNNYYSLAKKSIKIKVKK